MVTNNVLSEVRKMLAADPNLVLKNKAEHAFSNVTIVEGDPYPIKAIRHGIGCSWDADGKTYTYAERESQRDLDVIVPFEIMKEYLTTATRTSVRKKNNEEEDCFEHFGIRPTFCCLYGNKPEDIINVRCEVTDVNIDNRDRNNLNVEYWGWISRENPETVSMIHGAYFLFNMCFPNGAEICERRGQGKCVNLKIEEVK